MTKFPSSTRKDHAKEDREALEHIARALGKPPLTQIGAEPEENGSADPVFDHGAVEALLEALPAALAILSGDMLLVGNAAFANAFGYRSFADFKNEGGLAAIVPSGLDKAETVMRSGPGQRAHLRVEAVTRGRRRIKVHFDLVPLEGQAGLQMLRLVDQTATKPEREAPLPKPLMPEALSPETPSPAAPNVVSMHGPESGSVATHGRYPTAEQQLGFLAKISHEVRTPLNSIVGFAELMMGEKLGPIGNERYKGYIEDIRQSGLYALSLLNDLLDLSKIEAGEFELDFTAVNIGEMIDECVRLLQPLAKRERILLRVTIGPEVPSVIADPRRLKQILFNLLSNAIKFTREGGQVIVSARMVHQGQELQLRIRDNGVGMSEDELRLAMQPFQQLDTAPRKLAGTGLGLPLTKALIEASRARFSLKSEPGIGTSADVIFPKDRLVGAKR